MNEKYKTEDGEFSMKGPFKGDINVGGKHYEVPMHDWGRFYESVGGLEGRTVKVLRVDEKLLGVRFSNRVFFDETVALERED